MKISNNVYVLEVIGKKTYYPVILHDEENLVLVDAGFPLDFEILSDTMKNSGFDVKNINKIIITHQDIDHIGCIKEILKVSPKVEIMAYIDEAPYIDGRKLPIKVAKMDTANPFYEQFKAGFDNRRIDINTNLIDNQTLPFCGGVKVIHSPGHTPGHICLYVEKDKIMICGDALNVNDGKLTGANPIHSDNMIEAEQSALKLMNYDVNIFATYHGGIYEHKN